MTERIQADDLYLFAINSGDLYTRHCTYGRCERSLPLWIEHVERRVIQSYKFQRKTRARVADGAPTDVAARLKEYYEAHVKEG